MLLNHSLQFLTIAHLYFRLDFSKFHTAQPNSEGVCGNDVFSVGGTDLNVPSICGENKGQHSKYIVKTELNDALIFRFVEQCT